MTDNDSTDDDLLLDKINALYAAEQMRPEARLCALVLSTRLVHDASWVRLQQQQQTQLDEFTVSILEQHQALLTQQSKHVATRNRLELAETLTCLVAQVLARLWSCTPPLSTKTSNLQKTDGTRHSSCLFELVRLRRTQNIGCTIARVDLEILVALQSYQSTSNSEANVAFLDQLWDIYQPSPEILPTKAQPNSTATASDAVSSDHRENGNDDDNQVMLSTLQALLQQTSRWDDATNFGDAWNELVLTIFQEHCTIIYGDQRTMRGWPSFWSRALKWLSQPPSTTAKHVKKAQTNRLPWVWLLLYMLDACCLGKDAGPQGDEEWADLVQLLLATVVSPSQDIPTLRTLAWAVTSDKWTTILNQIGLSKQVYSLLRLAVGEYKIQLESALRPSSSQPDETQSIAESLSLLQACGQMITLTIEWTTQMDQDDAGAVPAESTKLTKSSIQHVRHSLEQALDLCVQYFLLTEDELSVIGRETRSTLNTTLIGVFGTLLTEFDAFTHSKGDSEQVASLIQALGRAVEVASSPTLTTATASSSLPIHPCCLLIPSVTTVLASAQGHSDRVAMLSKWSDGIVRLIDSFWKFAKSDEKIVTWACQLMELFVDMFPVDQKTSNRWKDALVAFLNHHSSSSEQSKSTVQAVVGCFVTLQGDEPPEGLAAETIQLAMTQLEQVLE